MGFAHQCFWAAGGIFALMIAVTIFVFGDGIAEAIQRFFQRRVARSWPVRFFTYRSGHGRHSIYA